MPGALIALLVIGGLALIVVFWFVGTYNSLIGLRNRVKEAWAQIDVQLKRRYDLIPNLLNTVKGYMKHEQQILENIAKARSMAIGARSIGETAQAEGLLTAGLRQLFAVAEAYPDLKANQNFMALHEELVATENKISFSRQHYNESVLRYNDKIQMMPSNIVAGMFNFKAEEFFEVETPEERKVVKVEF